MLKSDGNDQNVTEIIDVLSSNLERSDLLNMIAATVLWDKYTPVSSRQEKPRSTSVIKTTNNLTIIQFPHKMRYAKIFHPTIHN